METLENYLTEEHPFDLRDISEIEKLVISATKTYEVFFDKDKFAWPYEKVAKAEIKNTGGHLSISTTSMILNALLVFGNYFNPSDSIELGNIPRSTIFPIKIDNSIKKAIKERIVQASDLLLANILDLDANKIKTKSSTFGKNDVFTFAWLSEVSRADWIRIYHDENDIYISEEAREKRQETAKKKLAMWGKVGKLILTESTHKLKNCNKFENTLVLFNPPKSKPQKHAFPALRLVQTIRQIDGKNYGALADYYEYFERSLHEQLSFSSIPDSRFDPAELMFCLEGMLLCQRNTVDRTLFDRVVEVLTLVQHENAYWRPVKPYLATSQGLVLFPVSIEVANSLLRACAIFDKNRLHDTYGSKSILLLRRYWQWLRARAVRLTSNDNEPELVGWHSEHVNETTTIHLWETSQVIEFLLSYRNALQAHIARTTLVRSRFTKENFKREDWNTIKENFESVTSLGDSLQIYKEIGQSFIDPHLSGDGEKNYSMLLYGPPGTGKSTIAENIAKGLNRNLIQITVSDFLEGGGVQVEARAKNIFEVLMAQPSSVVLFDEIDHFLLDRDSDRYSKQDTIFQFMTPGMLTKLNNLRRKNSVIFIIATNYEDRIDSAIKRIGRIDKKYLVLPPDLTKRVDKLKHFTKQGAIFEDSISDGLWNDLGVESVFLGHNDFRNAVSLFKQEKSKTVKNFKDLLSGMARTSSIEAYSSRFKSYQGGPLNIRETPLCEFLFLVALRLQTKKVLSDDELAVIKSAADVIKSGQLDKLKDIDSQFLKGFSRELDGLDRTLLDGIVNALNS